MRDREAEIQQIEQDLRNLQRRYATLDRSARRMRVVFYFLMAALVGIITAALIMGNLAALAISTWIFLMAGAMAYASRHARWIDFASGPWGWASWAVKYVEAQAVEDMVAERMERLARLKGNYK